MYILYILCSPICIRCFCRKISVNLVLYQLWYVLHFVKLLGLVAVIFCEIKFFHHTQYRGVLSCVFPNVTLRFTILLFCSSRLWFCLKLFIWYLKDGNRIGFEEYGKEDMLTHYQCVSSQVTLFKYKIGIMDKFAVTIATESDEFLSKFDSTTLNEIHIFE